MKSSKLRKILNLLGALIGLFMIIFGFSYASNVNVDGNMSRLCSLIGGLGGGLIGGCLADYYKISKIEKDPTKMKELEINLHDERNIFIRNKAAAKSGSIINWVFIILAYVCIVFDYPTWLVFTFLGIFVFKHIMEYMLIKKYDQEY